MPARAPASIDMLQTVIRSSIESARMAEPRYSMTWPVPPPMPSRAITARTTSLAVTPGRSVPSTVTASVLGGCCSRLCVARTCATSLVPMPNASAPNAPCVLVWLSPQTMTSPGCVTPQLRADDVDDPLPVGAERVQLDAEVGAVLLQRRDLQRRRVVEHRDLPVAPARGGGRRVIHGGHRPLGAPHLEAALAQPGEGLRRGDLVDQVQVDVEDGRRVGAGGAHQVGLPDLLEHRARFHGPTLPPRPGRRPVTTARPNR